MTTPAPREPGQAAQRGMNMPITPETIRARAVEYNGPACETWDELTEQDQAECTAMLARIQAGDGEAEVWVHCFSDTGTGWNKRAVITAGVRLDGYHIPAHRPVVYHCRKTPREGALKAHEVVKRRIWRKNPKLSRLVIHPAVPIRWETDPRP